MKNNYALIMAGGIGSRFWPVSRTNHPKQFLDILGTGKTLIQSTYERFLKILPPENIFIVTNEMYVPLVKEQLPDVSDQNVLGEPVMRNTAPCIAYGSYKIKQLNPDAAIVVAPSDHLILETDAFLTALTKCFEKVHEQDCLVTLGIQPSRPDTGYGYIQFTDEKLGDLHKIKTFTEKPNLDLAKTFVQSGEFLWNAGIFIWSARSIAKAFETYLPEMAEIFSEGRYNSDEEQPFIQAAYYQCTNISIDYGIMEKADNVYVLPASFGWSDLGTWSSVYDLAEKDYVGNAVIPADKVMMYDSANCMVNVPKDKLVILQGLHDYIVVENDEILLILPRNEEQSVKQIVADVKQRFGNEYS